VRIFTFELPFVCVEVKGERPEHLSLTWLFRKLSSKKIRLEFAAVNAAIPEAFY
jgi:hypothetical protein